MHRAVADTELSRSSWIHPAARQAEGEADKPSLHTLHVSAVWSCLEWPFCAAASDEGNGVVCGAGFIILFSLGFF